MAGGTLRGAPLPEPATWGHRTGMREDVIFLQLKSSRPPETEDGLLAEPMLTIKAMPFNTWQFVKRKMKEQCRGFRDTPDHHIRLLYKGMELKNDGMVEEYEMAGGTECRPIKIDYLVTNSVRQAGEGRIGIYLDPQVPSTRLLKERVQEVWGAMLRGIQPSLTDDGTGATYFMYDSNKKKKLAVFKPKDEEAFAPHNPRGYKGPENSVSLREGVFSTQQAAREVAAFLLDHNRFAGVPETTLVHARHPKFQKADGQIVWKIGAFQLFVECTDTAGNWAPQLFTSTDVHRIGILDIRIVNLDRNDGNLLVIKREKHKPWHELVPIDHGLSMPDRLQVYLDDCCWISWPQAHQPFDSRELSAKTTKDMEKGDCVIYMPTKGFKMADRVFIGDFREAHILVQINHEGGYALMNFGIPRECPAGTTVRLQSSLAFINDLDGERDAQFLAEKLGIRRECLRLVEVATKLLQIGAAHGLTLYEIGSIIYREDRGGDAPQQPSPLERLISDSMDTALAVADRSLDSATLSGLDLELSRPHGKRSSLLQPPAPSAGGGGGPGTPSMGPSSPCPGSPQVSSTASPKLSPKPGDPPPLLLDGADSDDAAPCFNLSLTEMPFPTSVRLPEVREEADDWEKPRKHKTGTGTKLRHVRPSARAAPHREGKGKDSGGSSSIFTRKDLPASDWSQELEVTFRRHIAENITKYIKKHFNKEKATERASGASQSAAEARGASAPERETSLASALPRVLPGEITPTDSAGLPTVMEDTAGSNQDAEAATAATGAAAAAALTGAEAGAAAAAATPVPSTLEALGTPGPRRYVPPHLRAAKAAEEAAAKKAAEEEAAAKKAAEEEAAAQAAAAAAAAEAEPKRYVPPHLRRAKVVSSDPSVASSSIPARLGHIIPTPAVEAPQADAEPRPPAAIVNQCTWGNGRCGLCMDKGRRQYMEDVVDVIADLCAGEDRGEEKEEATEFYAVYDGHNGTSTVLQVKKLLPELLKKQQLFKANGGGFDRIFKDVFKTVDEQVLEMLRQEDSSSAGKPAAEEGEEVAVAQDSSKLDDYDASPASSAPPMLPRTLSIQNVPGGISLSSGCVAVVALVKGSKLHIANLGDCRAVLCEGGTMQLLTEDHRPHEHPQDKERLARMGLEVSTDGYLHGRISVSRAFGDLDLDAEEKCVGLISDPEVYQVEITDKTEFLILACDGIFENEKMTVKDVGQTVRRSLRKTGGNTQEAAEALVRLAKKGGSDNLSAVVVLFKIPPPVQSSKTA